MLLDKFVDMGHSNNSDSGKIIKVSKTHLVSVRSNLGYSEIDKYIEDHAIDLLEVMKSFQKGQELNDYKTIDINGLAGKNGQNFSKNTFISLLCDAGPWIRQFDFFYSYENDSLSFNSYGASKAMRDTDLKQFTEFLNSIPNFSLHNLFFDSLDKFYATEQYLDAPEIMFPIEVIRKHFSEAQLIEFYTKSNNLEYLPNSVRSAFLF